MANIYGTNLSETLYGTNLSDSIYGYNGNDTIFGFGGNDYINGGQGADKMYGGTGNDYYVVDSLSDKVVEYGGQGTDTVYTTASGYTLSDHVENLVMGGSIYSGYGNALNNTIWGNNANNYINGGKGADKMYGYGGNDFYVVDSFNDKVFEYAGQGTDTVFSNISGYALANNVENLFMGGSIYSGYGNALNNTIWGNSANNYIHGGAGNDKIYALAGHDYINGGLGADQMHGGIGNDTYVVDNVGDIVTEAAGQGYDTVRASVTEFLSANVERLILTGAGNINGYGNSLSNSLIGNAGNNYLYGSGGHDAILGGAGTDTVVGGTGNDILNGYGGSSGEYDILAGDFSSSKPGVKGTSDGADVFVLGDSSKAFYLGLGYATIKDFYWAEGDKFQVHGNQSDYTLNKNFNYGGTGAKDTAIFHQGDLIGVVQDTTNVILGADFQFV